MTTGQLDLWGDGPAERPARFIGTVYCRAAGRRIVAATGVTNDEVWFAIRCDPRYDASWHAMVIETAEEHD